MNLQKLKAVLGAKQPGTLQQPAEAGAAADTAATSAEQDAALAAVLAEAKAEGVKDGTKASIDRFAAILGDDKVKGKERAALDLAIKSPEMSAADVVAFVSTHAGAAPATQTIEQRMNGQGAALSLGAPMQPAGGAAAAQKSATVNPSAIYESRRKATIEAGKSAA